MAKIPEKPQDIFAEFTSDLQRIFGEDLISIILYGSGASGHYLPGKSDLNFLVILSEAGIEDLKRVMDTVAQWKKRKVATPLFMSLPYLCASLDAYPVEFLNMQRHYITVFGEDVLAGLSFDHKYLRLQLERELKGKLIHLQKGFLETEGKQKRIRQLVRISLTAFLSLFRGLLLMKGMKIPHGRREIIQSVAQAFSFDASVLLKCLDIREGIDRFSPPELEAVAQSYLTQISRLCEAVDKMD